MATAPKARRWAVIIAGAMVLSAPLAATGSDVGAPSAAPVRPSQLDATVVASLASQIIVQVRPCYVPAAVDDEARNIVTRLRIRLNSDGSLAEAPEILNQIGVTSTNQAFAPQMAQAATLAVQHCAPLKLPAQLYDAGWKDFILRFNPRSMN